MQNRAAVWLGDDFEYRFHTLDIRRKAYACQGIYIERNDRVTRSAGLRRASRVLASVKLVGLPTTISCRPRLSDPGSQLCALERCLNALAHLDPRRAQVVELRFFGGLTVEETGQVLKISPQSVMLDWKLARAWLARELNA